MWFLRKMEQMEQMATEQEKRRDDKDDRAVSFVARRPTSSVLKRLFIPKKI